MSETTTQVRLCHLEELPVGQGRAFEVAGEQVAVFRTRRGEVHALGALCTHRGGPIADGQSDERTVVCPLHNHEFELATGACTTGQPDLARYQVSVGDDGAILVSPPG